MRDPVAFLLFVSLLAIVFPKGNEGYSQEEYEKFNSTKEEFNVWDSNKDGYVDKEELSKEMKPDYVKYVLGKFDADGDGRMNFEELEQESINYPTSGWNQTDAFYVDEVYQKSGNETVLDRKY